VIDIRHATAADLDAVTAIYNDEVRESTTTMDTEPRDGPSRRRWFAEHASAAYPLLVAEVGGDLVGWGTLSPWSPRGGYARTVEASVFVRRGARHSGAGTALLGSLIEQARRAGHRVVLGRIEATNEASRRLALSLGFTSVGVMHRVGEKLGRVLDVELFEVMVGDGAGHDAPAGGCPANGSTPGESE
jgi:L-amino acid N-acyltransferase YncA